MKILKKIFTLLFNLFKSSNNSNSSSISNSISSSSSSSSSSSGLSAGELPMEKRIKRAVIVGINKYDIPGNNLNGCVNDAEDVYDLLTQNFGFEKDNIRVLTDERATKYNIEQRLRWLIEETEKGDEAVYYHSGHGTQVRDRNGDDLNDYMDECLVTSDFDWDDPLLDDIIGDIFKELKEGAFLTMICDTCHSGTIDRAFGGNKEQLKVKMIPAPFDIAARSSGRALKIRRIGEKFIDSSNQRHVLLSGCQDNETSQESMIGSNVRGALTYSLTKLLRNGPTQNWKQIHAAICADLKNSGFGQNPNLTGKDELISRITFGDK